MKSKLILSIFMIGSFLAMNLLTGCATPQNPYTYQGAGLGAAVGAAIGAGVNGKNPWKGAGIGALIGGATGAIGGEIYGRSNPYCPPDCPPQQRGYGYSQPYPGYYPQGAPPPQNPYATYQGRVIQDPSYQYGY